MPDLSILCKDWIMKKIVLSLLLLILFTGLCFAQKAYKVKDKQLDEISGIAASRANPGWYYVHNDSGGKGEVYVINTKGRLIGTIMLTTLCSIGGEDGESIAEFWCASTKNRDWEDIAVGPGPEPGTNYLYVGEIGDNKAQYNNTYLYRTKEIADHWFLESLKMSAKRTSEKSWKASPSPVDTLAFIYADGPKDCETLMIDPANGDVYLVSKREEKVGVYQIKAPLSTDSLNVAKRILSLDFPLAVGGDISPQRDKIIIKTYNKIYQWQIAPGQSIAEALSGPYENLPYKFEPQGEAICFSADGKSYLTISERAKKKPLYLYIYP